MKYLELYIHSMIEKQAQNTVPANRTNLSLPGLKTAKELDLEQIKRYKKKKGTTHLKGKENIHSIQETEVNNEPVYISTRHFQ